MKKINPILQMNQTECGLCAAAMLMEYYGIRINIHDISTKFIVSQVSPCIAYKTEGHFVVIESVVKNKIRVLDPSIGRIEIERQELDEEYLNILIKIEPQENFQKINTRGGEFKLIWNALTSNINIIYKVLITTLFVYAITLSLPILVKKMVDLFLSEGTLTNQVELMAIFIICGSFIYIFINSLKLRASVRLSISIDRFLSVTVIDKLFRNKFEYFISRMSSDIQYRLALLKSLKTIISNVVIQTMLDLGTMFLIFIYISTINIIYAILLLFLTVIMIAFSLIIKDRMLMLKNKELSSDNNLQVLQYDIFRSIFDVKVLALTEEKQKLWKKYYEKFIISHKQSQLFISHYHNFLSYITLYVPIFITLIGILYSVTNGVSELSTIISFQSMAGIYINGLISISQLSDNLTTMRAYITRIQDVLLQENEKCGDREIDFKGNITIENLSFKYPGAKSPTIKNINFTIEEGESVAIVGESASGKSTLFYILLGVYDTYEGYIGYEGVDLKYLNKDNLRSQIGVVSQNPLLFSGSIRENISSDKTITDERLYDVLKKVSMHEFVKSLPMGLNTIIAENGFNLSGGQKQRLALARAIVNHKDVLILDEATSSLDNITEHSIVNYLNNESKTKIVIAHRLNTIKNCDRIVVLKNGEICEIGTHKELMSHKSEYYKMYREEILI